MARISACIGVLVFASIFSGCCHQGSPFCHLNYPNLIGYTYPNWCPPPLITPPNGPPDEVLEEIQNAENVPENVPEGEAISPGIPAPLPTGNEMQSVLSLSRK